jgi:thiol-disulfide isomerase/thioredoxin
MLYSNITKIKFQILLIYLLIFISGCSSKIPAKVLEGYESPTLRFYTLEDGSEITLRSFPNRVKVVLFWNTHCGASKRALESLDRLALQFKHYPEESRPVFIGVNLDPSDRLADVKSEIRKRQIYSIFHMMSGNDRHDQAYIQMLGEELPHIALIDKDDTVILVTGDIEELEKKL